MPIPLGIGLTRLLISLALGGLIGLEREIHKSPAGLRTVSLVTVGATLYTLASMTIIAPGVDISRIVAQIVIGIGFIGGGVIFQLKDTIHGLTTAASLWTAAAIGIMVGIGEYTFAVVTTVLVMLILWTGKFEKKYLPHESFGK